jgi:hypothetical protein
MISREDFEQHSCWHLKRGRGGISVRWRWEETACYMEFFAFESTTDRNSRRWDITVPPDEAYDRALGAVMAFAAAGMDERIAKAASRLVDLPTKLVVLPDGLNPWHLNLGKGFSGPVYFFCDGADDSKMLAVSARESQYDMSRKACVIGCARAEDGEWSRTEVPDDLLALGASEGFSWSGKAMANLQRSASHSPRAA